MAAKLCSNRSSGLGFEISVGDFETMDLEPGADAVFSATAYHWISCVIADRSAGGDPAPGKSRGDRRRGPGRLNADDLGLLRLGPARSAR